MLNSDIERFLLCVEKITTVVIFLSNCLEFKICKSGFMFATAHEMKFEMSSEIRTGTTQSCRSGKRFKKM
jgi:hypothetical protein